MKPLNLTPEENRTRAAILDVIDDNEELIIALAGNGDEANQARLDFADLVLVRTREFSRNKENHSNGN